MDRKELFMNVRKAYRLAYEVQDSIVGTVEYIRDRIRYTACAGSQLFSDPIEKYKSAIDGEADQKFGKDSWGKKGSWKYLPTYMYMYYFQCKPTETQNCCFAIVQVMDDGFAELPETNASPSTEFFKSPEDSQSYLLFAFSIWKDQDYIWFYRNEKKTVLPDMETEILRIGETIKGKGYLPYVVSSDTSTFVVTRINLESIGSKAETGQVLQDFAKLILDKTGYQLLIEEPKEWKSSQPVLSTQSGE